MGFQDKRFPMVAPDEPLRRLRRHRRVLPKLKFSVSAGIVSTPLNAKLDAATHVCYGSDVLAMRILDGVEVNESGKVHLSFALTSSVSLRLSSACKVRSKDLARCDDKFIQCTGMVPVIIDSTEKSVRFKMQCHQEQLADDR